MLPQHASSTASAFSAASGSIQTADSKASTAKEAGGSVLTSTATGAAFRPINRPMMADSPDSSSNYGLEGTFSMAVFDSNSMDPNLPPAPQHSFNMGGLVPLN